MSFISIVCQFWVIIDSCLSDMKCYWSALVLFGKFYLTWFPLWTGCEMCFLSSCLLINILFFSCLWNLWPLLELKEFVSLNFALSILLKKLRDASCKMRGNFLNKCDKPLKAIQLSNEEQKSHTLPNWCRESIW